MIINKHKLEIAMGNEVAQLLYAQLTAEGYSPQKAVSLVYRAGLIDGRSEERQYQRDKAQRAEFYKQKQRNQVEAPGAVSKPDSLTFVEGSDTNE